MAPGWRHEDYFRVRVAFCLLFGLYYKFHFFIIMESIYAAILMHRQQIELMLEGTLQPVESAVTLFSSTDTPWSGFLLERHRTFAGQARNCVWPALHIVVVTAGRAEIKFLKDQRHHRFIVQPDSVTVWPEGFGVESLSWSGQCDTLEIQLSQAEIEEAVGKQGRTSSIRLLKGILEQQIGALVRNMEAEIKAGCPAGKLYGESLSTALAVYLCGRYSTGTQLQNAPETRLSSRQLHQVQDYIHANLGGNLTLAVLARLVEFSPHHFCQLFRNTAGITPHQYVIQARIDRSKKLLLQRQTTITEVALTLGFSSQSHFTSAFRQWTGMTPRRFLRAS